MYRFLWAFIGAVVFVAPGSACAADEAELSKTLRTLLLKHLPDPLYEKATDWGKKKEFRELRIRRGKAAWEWAPKNDGLWRKIKVVAVDPHKTVTLRLADIHRDSPQTTSFTLFVAGDVWIDAAQEQWETGIKLYGASVRARARIWAKLRCNVSVKTEFKQVIPDLVCTMRVEKSEVGYDNVVVEHIAGLGGDAARFVGATGLKMIHQWKPSLERHLLDKANAAILKAGQDKEIRLGLSKMFLQK
jgi:hypothetical protein